MLKIKTLQAHSGIAAKWILGILPAAILSVYLSDATAEVRSDVLEVPGYEQGDTLSGDNNVILPRRGISKSQVAAEFGEPNQRHPAVGDPPITRWDYDGFSVFFEYQHVLHSVVPERPKHIYNKDELQYGY